jgi:hypothetical protein
MWTLVILVTFCTLLGYALAGIHDRLQRKAFEATLTEIERARFKVYRLVLPWRNFTKVVEIDRAETLTKLIDRQHNLKAVQQAIRHSKSIQDDTMSADISSLTDRVRALHEEIRAARAA